MTEVVANVARIELSVRSLKDYSQDLENYIEFLVQAPQCRVMATKGKFSLLT